LQNLSNKTLEFKWYKPGELISINPHMDICINEKTGYFMIFKYVVGGYIKHTKKEFRDIIQLVRLDNIQRTNNLHKFEEEMNLIRLARKI
jgi:hypothetical protein